MMSQAGCDFVLLELSGESMVPFLLPVLTSPCRMLRAGKADRAALTFSPWSSHVLGLARRMANEQHLARLSSFGHNEQPGLGEWPGNSLPRCVETTC